MYQEITIFRSMCFYKNCFPFIFDCCFSFNFNIIDQQHSIGSLCHGVNLINQYIIKLINCQGKNDIYIIISYKLSTSTFG